MEDTKCFLAVLEFLITQAAKHMVTDTVLNKDLLQMGIAIENVTAIVKVYNENLDNLGKALKA
eukprot:CAMPEP_0170557782 /NCGR_PEP_ID=MMETSP0211-20121228/30153_1 /TAXON_ID=311385 /ORGANISM="Pseudokeronopsis sp., Strain OXSARD2" /LENGTH=62 /DNA_ID=CAMNT_0010869125 /DNA_START=126 /DNA_END=314 /DNA_ORIENTATION=+